MRTNDMQLRHFDSDGVDIAFIDEGEGDPVLLIHGFASNIEVNWVGTGWVSALRRAGHRVVALDNRGHGHSEKIYDPAAYAASDMAEDARRLLDHLGIERSAVMGYSMGARITAFLAIRHPGRVERAVFGGLGINMVRGVGDPAPIVAALEAGSLEEVPDPVGRTFRSFAEQTGSDLRALAACMRSSRPRISPELLGSLAMPVLVVVGSADEVGGDPHLLAELIPNGRAVSLPGRDHMKAVGDRQFKEAVIAFLREP
ncbi:alpha/beta fold hydrolase [Tepidamorphus gemmatus]|nr:alpha/beta hydrolase [Tepidamorphus gemmatus]